MLEMLRKWREPAMSALLIYHGLSRPGIHVTLAKIHINKKETRTMHFFFIKESIFKEHGKCRKYNRKQVFLTF